MYIWANNDFLTHRRKGIDYTFNNTLHSVALKEYIKSGRNYEFLLEDINSPQFLDYVSSEVIRNAVFNETPEYAKTIMYIDINEIKSIGSLEKIVLKNFKRYITEFNDKYIFYKGLLHFSSTETETKEFKNDKETFELLIQMFSMISGSRYLFRQYFDTFLHDEKISI
ncbi:hypothetical protein [Pseudogracilibacillus sp. SO30301A]|uniref:hypothetical protein n=1 Tax=Pseudogracilibacillus sp. SO30301A TaxID=3098291 RepID=UPI00300E2667